MMRKIDNACYLDMENKIIAIDAETSEEAREIAIQMLRQLEVRNEYAEMHEKGLVDEDLLLLHPTENEGEAMLNNNLEDEEVGEIIMRDYEPVLREALHRILGM